ncbi:MAG: four helix bundle protein [Rhodothermales bacterium]
MKSINGFEDLVVWQEGIKLADAIYEITCQESFARDRSLRDQLRRAAVSVSSNIAEGYERNANAEFLYFLSVAKGSAGELRSLLYVARNAAYIEDAAFATLSERAALLSRRLFALMAAIKKSGWKGIRHKPAAQP